MRIAPPPAACNSPQDINGLSTSPLTMTDDFYVLYNGHRIAWVGDADVLYLNPSNMLEAFDGLSLRSIGEIVELLSCVVGGQMGAAQ